MKKKSKDNKNGMLWLNNRKKKVHNYNGFNNSKKNKKNKNKRNKSNLNKEYNNKNQ
jgi:hypothetical protein